MIYKIAFSIVSVFLLAGNIFGQAATQYNLDFSPNLVGDKLFVTLLLSFDSPDEIGTSSFSYNFNSSALSNPTLVSNSFNSNYQTPTLTTPLTGVNSFNIELNNTNSGITIGSSLQGIATIQYDIDNPNDVAGLVWRISGAPRTEVFLDDNATQLTLGNVNNAPDFPLLIVLPVELISFQAQLNDQQQVALDWKTASEENNDFFEVQRSTDGQHFVEIDRVAGSGYSSAELAYSVMDKFPAKGINYYRLKQVDRDGKFTFSNIEAVQLSDDQLKMKIFPQPTSGSVNLSFSKYLEGADIFVFNAAGKQVFHRIVNGEQDQLSLSHLAKGLYFLQVEYNGQQLNDKIVLIP